jgi:hypothetical protein
VSSKCPSHQALFLTKPFTADLFHYLCMLGLNNLNKYTKPTYQKHKPINRNLLHMKLTMFNYKNFKSSKFNKPYVGSLPKNHQESLAQGGRHRLLWSRGGGLPRRVWQP